MHNPFTPSTVYPPVTYDADPKAYVALGRGVARGKREFVMSRGELVRFNANPWKWMRAQPDEENEAMAWGSLVDCIALTPQRLSECYEVCPETYPAKAKCGEMEDKPWNWNAGYCKDWRDGVVACGKSPLKLTTLEAAREASARLMGDPLIARLMECSRKQVQAVAEYRDKDTGIVVQVKTLLDLVPDAKSPEFGQFLADLKTTQDASIQTWERTVFARGYEVQAGLYTDVFNAAAQEDRRGFLHAVQESEQPYAVARRMLSEEFMDNGRDTYRRALKRYCRCLATGQFPGYDDEGDNNANPIVDGWRLTQPAPWMIAA